MGVGDTNNRVVPTLVSGLKGKEIAGCACGQSHSIVWTTDKDVYATGTSKEGALGLGDTTSRPSLTLIRALSGKNIGGVACGDAHTIVWMADKGVYSFGQGRYGQLGNAESANVTTPMAIPGFANKKIVGAVCGGSHTIMWTAENEVYSFGYGKNGQLGHGDSNNQDRPTLIAAMKDREIAGAACGASHSMIWTKDNITVTFGHGGNGRLGHGDASNKLVPTPVAPLRNKKVTGGACGPNHSFVWTSEGEVFSFGFGSYGQLGHGDTSHKLTPTPVSALKGKNVAGISCGGATVVWTSGLPSLLKGLDQLAVQQLQNILHPTQKSEHPLASAALASLKETVMDKELTLFVNTSESLAELLPSTQEDGKEAYLRLQLEKASQKRESGMQRSDVVAVVEEERKIVDLRTQLLQMSQDQPKKVSVILERAEEGIPAVGKLEDKVMMQQSEAELGLKKSEECIEQCTAECAAESSELSACQAEVERLKKCLQDAEQTVIRQQDKVVQADKKLDAMKAQRTAYVSVIQACENAHGVITEAQEQRADLRKQLSGILAQHLQAQDKEQTEQNHYFSSVLPEFVEREKYYIQRAGQAHRMIDPRLEKEMQSVSLVMGTLTVACRQALELIPENLRTHIDIDVSHVTPTLVAPSSPAEGSPVRSENGKSNAAEDEPQGSRRTVACVPRDKLGTRFTKLVTGATVSMDAIVKGLQRYAEAEELPKCSRLLAQMAEKMEDFQGEGDSAECALAKACFWLYSTDSWVFERVNNALMNDSGVALTDLGPYIKALMDLDNALPADLHYTGTLYRRTKLTEQQLAKYVEGQQFTWPVFCSASPSVDSSDATGRHLLCINVPEGLAASAVDIHSISSSHEEEVVLQCYSWLTVSRVHRGPTDIAGIDVLIELELATPPEA